MEPHKALRRSNRPVIYNVHVKYYVHDIVNIHSIVTIETSDGSAFERDLANILRGILAGVSWLHGARAARVRKIDVRSLPPLGRLAL
jgi:hypothetical protein